MIRKHIVNPCLPLLQIFKGPGPMTLASVVHLCPHLPVLRRAEQAWDLQSEGQDVMPRFVIHCFSIPERLLPEPHLLHILTKRDHRKTQPVAFYSSPRSCFSAHTTVRFSNTPSSLAKILYLLFLCQIDLSCYTPDRWLLILGLTLEVTSLKSYGILP